MPYRAARIAALLQPGLIARSRMPNTAGRVAETVVKRNLFSLEDLAVRAQAELYRGAFNALRETAEGAGLTPDNAWQARVNAGAERILTQLAQDVRKTAEKAVSAAFDVGYYGRAWVLDMMTKPDVAIKSPMVSLTQRPLMEAATYSDAAQLEQALRQWLMMYGDELDTLIPQIRVAVSSGMTNGEGIDAIMRRVRSVMGVDTDRRFGPVGSAERRGYRANFNRVQVITRTVVNQASNQGAWEAYQRNADVLTGYQWVTARDERACDRCAQLDGTTYKLSDTFRPPAHPNCILPGNEVVLPGALVGGAKSFYSGRCIEIHLGNGRSLRVTQNHPILTDRGWVRAQFVCKGEKVVTARDNGQRIATAINPDNNHAPSVIEQVFRSLEETSAVSAGRMEVTAEDFHGDGRFMDGNVHIVNVNGLLLGNTESAPTQTASESTFSRCSVCGGPLFANSSTLQLINSLGTTENSLMSGTDHVGAFSKGGTGPAEFHAGASITGLNTSLNQAAADDRTRQPGIGGELFFTDTRQVAGDQVIGNGQPATAYGNTGLFDAIPDDLGIDPTLAGQFLDRFASEITLNKVVEVVEFDFTGHVYDLQVEPYQLYICNGVVVKNCRCTVMPVLSPDLQVRFSDPPRETFEEWARGRGIAGLWSFKPTMERLL